MAWVTFSRADLIAGHSPHRSETTTVQMIGEATARGLTTKYIRSENDTPIIENDA